MSEHGTQDSSSNPASADPTASRFRTAEERTAEEIEEARLLRRLQFMMSLTMQTIAQSPGLSVEEASQMIADARAAALAMFPGKDLAYDLIWRPRFQRLMRERYRLM
jgi:hypothetical protein